MKAIRKVHEIRDDVIIQPTLITVQKDLSIKIALDARALNQAIDKDEYNKCQIRQLT